MPDYQLKENIPGKVRTACTGAIRDANDGKGRPDLDSPLADKRRWVLLQRGADKRGARNWEKGLPLSWYIESLKRHIRDYQEGDRSEDHPAAMQFNAMALTHTEEAIKRGLLPKELDDLPKYLPEPPPGKFNVTCTPDFYEEMARMLVADRTKADPYPHYFDHQTEDWANDIVYGLYDGVEYYFVHRDGKQEPYRADKDLIKKAWYRIPAATALARLRKPELIYVSGPFSADPNLDVAFPTQRTLNRINAEAVAKSLALRGHKPHCPHAATAFLEGYGMEYEDFMELDLAILGSKKADGTPIFDALYYIRSSPGADRELALAEQLGLKIYRRLSEVPDLRAKG